MAAPIKDINSVKRKLLDAGVEADIFQEVAGATTGLVEWRVLSPYNKPLLTWGMCFTSVESLESTYAQIHPLLDVIHARDLHIKKYDDKKKTRGALTAKDAAARGKTKAIDETEQGQQAIEESLAAAAVEITGLSSEQAAQLIFLQTKMLETANKNKKGAGAKLIIRG